VLLALPISDSRMVVGRRVGNPGVPGLTCESAHAVSSCPTNDQSAGAQELSRHPTGAAVAGLTFPSFTRGRGPQDPPAQRVRATPQP